MQDVPSCIYDVKYIFPILNRVDAFGEVKASDLEALGIGWKTVDSRLKMLMELDIVETHVRVRGRRIRMYSLTEKGRKLYQLMCLGRRLVNGECSIEDGRIIELLEEPPEIDGD